MSIYVNDGTEEAPRLKIYLDIDNLTELRPDTVWPGLKGLPRDRKLMADGFEGVQMAACDTPCFGSPLPHCGLDRISTPSEAARVVAKHQLRGDVCLSVHAGWGLEDDDEAFCLVDAILAASSKYGLPVFLETHRATITQDIWRTVQLTRRFPELRFNGDFSHYYCGQELVYGDWAAKLAFMEPIFARVAFMHGRIASPGCMQVSIGPNLSDRPLQAHGAVDYLDHFKQLWTRAMTGFLNHASQGDVLIFAPELLSGTNYYARLFTDASGRLVEESDRYAQALLLKDLARSCFSVARSMQNKIAD